MKKKIIMGKSVLTEVLQQLDGYTLRSKVQRSFLSRMTCIICRPVLRLFFGGKKFFFKPPLFVTVHVCEILFTYKPWVFLEHPYPI